MAKIQMNLGRDKIPTVDCPQDGMECGTVSFDVNGTELTVRAQCGYCDNAVVFTIDVEEVPFVRQDSLR